MTSKQLLGWIFGASVLVTSAGCDVCTGDECPDIDFDGSFDEEEDTLDGGGKSDAAQGGDAGQSDGGDGDASSGDGDGDGGIKPGAPLSIEDFAQGQYQLRRDWEDQIEYCCMGNPEATSAEAKAILDIFGQDDFATKFLDRYMPLISGGSIKYEEEYGKACLDAFLAQYPKAPTDCPTGGFDSEGLRAMVGHGGQVLVQIPACRTAFAGTKARDESCTDTLECTAGLRCQTAVGGSGSKACLPAVGSVPTTGQCLFNGDCQDGHTCAGDTASANGRVCLPVSDLVNASGSCSFDRECKTGMICTVNDGTTGGVCKEVVDSAADNVCE